MAAMVAKYDIIRLEICQYTHGIGFLAEAGVGRAKEDPAGEILHHRFFEAADFV